MGQDTIQAIRDAEQKADQIEQQSAAECVSLLAQARSQAKTETAEALANARERFSLTEKEEDIILRHMWPLTITPPRFPESYVVVMFDKYCSLMETFHRPVMELLENRDLHKEIPV